MYNIHKFFTPLLALVLGTFFTVSAQQASHISGQLMVQTLAGHSIESIVSDLDIIDNKPSGLATVEMVSAHMQIWLLSFDENSIDEQRMLNAAQFHPGVAIAQYNHIVTDRAVPNDGNYGSQWQYDNAGGSGGVADADIDAPEAWDITTGGTTTQGDEIVACIIDDGINDAHADLGDNLWVNTAEIAGNGIDDDGNGFIDDVNGWNVSANNDNVSGGFVGFHGMPVAGIVGAQGNNSTGVAGVNWDVKLMIVKRAGTAESDVLEAYTYPLNLRKMYNESDGAEGAFVVSTNASWGVDFGQPANAPLWCAMYDTLGKYGITSCGATINGNYDVDVIGDLPTACPSPHLISVTNMWRDDVKVTSAGYGATTIDIGSFGQDAYTLTRTGYGGFGGTSGATPHITGAIALAYAAPCNNFIDLAKSDPEAASLQVIQWIYNGGDANASLAGITTSGKRQNLRGMLDELLNDCPGLSGGCPTPDGQAASVTSSTSANLSWNAIAGATGYQIHGRKAGTTPFKQVTTTTNSASVNVLQPSTSYEWKVRARCADGSISNFSGLDPFSTPTFRDGEDQLMPGIANVSINPNPADNAIRITDIGIVGNSLEQESNLSALIQVIDLSGRVLIETNATTSMIDLDVSTLPVGLYMVRIRIADEVAVQRFEVQR